MAVVAAAAPFMSVSLLLVTGSLDGLAGAGLAGASLGAAVVWRFLARMRGRRRCCLPSGLAGLAARLRFPLGVVRAVSLGAAGFAAAVEAARLQVASAGGGTQYNGSLSSSVG